MISWMKSVLRPKTENENISYTFDIGLTMYAVAAASETTKQSVSSESYYNFTKVNQDYRNKMLIMTINKEIMTAHRKR